MSHTITLQALVEGIKRTSNYYTLQLTSEYTNCWCLCICMLLEIRERRSEFSADRNVRLDEEAATDAAARRLPSAR